MIHLLKVLVKKIAKQSNITVIPCLLIYFSLDRLLLYLIFLNFARDKQYVLGTISIINIMKPTNLLLFSNYYPLFFHFGQGNTSLQESGTSG